MAQNDIRVRLTTEGLAEVVRGLRQVQSEASKAGSSSSKVLTEIRALLPTLGFGAAITGFAALVRNAANYADEIGKAATRTGTSAENFSVLAFAAKTADVGFEELQTTLARFARQLDGLREGAPEATKAFRDLGVTAADFEGKDTAEAFALVSEQMVKLGFNTKTTAASLELLGRGGARTLTLIKDLGEKGFAEVAKDAEAAGAIISTDLAKAAEAANDSMTAMGIVVQGLALQFVAGLAPSVNTALTEFRDDVQGKGIEPMKEFGESVGRVLRVTIAGFQLLATAGSGAIELIGKGLAGAAAQISGFFTGGVEGFRAAREALREDLSATQGQLYDNLEKGYLKLLDAIDTKPIEIKVRPSVDRRALDESGPDFQKLIQDRLQALAKQLGDQELKTLTEVAQRRRAIVEQGLELEKQRAQTLLALQQETRKGQEAQAQAEGQILAERVRAANAAFQAESALVRARGDQLAQAARKQYGDTRASAQLQAAIAQQTAAERLALEQKLVSDLSRLQIEYLNRYRAAREEIKRIDQSVAENRARHEQIFRDAIKSRQTDEQNAADAQREGFEKIRQLRAAAIAGDLQAVEKLNNELLEVVRTLANTEGFEGLAKQLSEEAQGLFKLSSDLQKQGLEKTAREAQSATKSLDQQLKEATETVKQLQAELVKGMTVRFATDDENMRDVVREIQRQIDEKPYTVRVNPQLTGGSSQAFAEGGMIAGSAPHPKADNVMIRATPGEFVQQVSAVNYYGAKFMADLNAKRIPRAAFADGGLVDEDMREDVRAMMLSPKLPAFADGGIVGIDDVRVGASIRVRKIPGFAAGGFIEQGVILSGEGSRDEVDVNLRVGDRRPVKLRGSRDQVRELVRTLQDAERGLTRK